MPSFTSIVRDILDHHGLVEITVFNDVDYDFYDIYNGRPEDYDKDFLITITVEGIRIIDRLDNPDGPGIFLPEGNFYDTNEPLRDYVEYDRLGYRYDDIEDNEDLLRGFLIYNLKKWYKRLYRKPVDMRDPCPAALGETENPHECVAYSHVAGGFEDYTCWCEDSTLFELFCQNLVTNFRPFVTLFGDCYFTQSQKSYKRYLNTEAKEYVLTLYLSCNSDRSSIRLPVEMIDFVLSFFLLKELNPDVVI